MAPEALDHLIQTAARVLLEEGAREVYVFGSMAEGRWRPGSDLDLAVEGLPAARYYHAVGRLLRELRVPVDLLPLESESPLIRRLRASGSLRRVA